MTFLLIAGFPDSLLLFRGPLLTALLAHGFSVHVAAPDLPAGSAMRLQLEARGLIVHSIPLSRAGMNPLADMVTLVNLWRMMRNICPSHVLGYTIKPVIYGTLAAALAHVPHRFALITGLGYAFTGKASGVRGVVRAAVQQLYASALNRAHKVFFQNPDDEALFRQLHLLPDAVPSRVVNGSGVDVTSFAVANVPVGPPQFLLIARLIGDKGIREFARAAQRVKATHPHARFAMVGWIDENPDAIAQAEIDQWVQAGTLDFLGRLADVRPASIGLREGIASTYQWFLKQPMGLRI